MPTGWWLYSYLALWFLVILTSGLLALLTRQVSALYFFHVKNDPDVGPTPGIHPLNFDAVTADGSVIHIPNLDERAVLYFFSPNCSGCRKSIGFLPAIQASHPSVRMIITVNSSDKEATEFLQTVGITSASDRFTLIAREDRHLLDGYQVPLVPYAVCIDSDGLIGASGHFTVPSDISLLLASTEELRLQRTRLQNKTTKVMA